MDKKSNIANEDKVKATLGNIKNFQKKIKAHSANTNLMLDIPLWQLGIEGAITFIIAFVCGKGLGIFYQVIFGS